jgi:5-methylthioadenosine/S-adenosylhomocysteine deaminase
MGDHMGEAPVNDMNGSNGRRGKNLHGNPQCGMVQKRLLIRNGMLVSSHESKARYADLIIQDGLIEDVLDSGCDASEAHTRVFDATDCILIPGLINAHTHSSGNLIRSLSSHWNLELQLNAGPAFRGEQTTREKYLTALVGALEAVSRGCTACYDFFYEYPLPSSLGLLQVGKAYRDVGLRAVIAPMVSDIPFSRAVTGLYGVLPEEVRRTSDSRQPQSCKAIIDSMGNVLNEWCFDWDRIRLGIAPTIPMHCSDDLHMILPWRTGLHSIPTLRNPRFRRSQPFTHMEHP